MKTLKRSAAALVPALGAAVARVAVAPENDDWAAQEANGQPPCLTPSGVPCYTPGSDPCYP